MLSLANGSVVYRHGSSSPLLPLDGMTAPMRSSIAAASSACFPLRECPASPIFAPSTSGSVAR